MSDKPKRAVQLAETLCMGLGTDIDAMELSTLLKTDQNALDAYIRFTDLHASLTTSHDLAAPTKVVTAIFPTQRTNWWKHGLVLSGAACFAGLCWISIQWLRTSNKSAVAGNASTTSCVATLLATDNCHWGDGVELVDGQRLQPQSLQLEDGIAILRFESGAEVIVHPQTNFYLESRGSMRLHQGQLTVRSTEEAIGFTVKTQSSDVVDLGTEFSIRVASESKATEIHVLEGKIAHSKPDTSKENGTLLEAGQAIRYETPTSHEPMAIRLAASRFSDFLDQLPIASQGKWTLANESFDYATGPFDLHDSLGGKGWASPWQVTSAGSYPLTDSSSLSIVESALNQNWSMPSGRITALEVSQSPAYLMRRLTEPLRLDRNQVYYVSLMVRREKVASVNEPARTRLALRDSEQELGDRIVFRTGALGRPQIEIRRGESFASPLTFTADGSQFWVGKIIARETGEDEVFFRVYEENDSIDRWEPAVWSIRTQDFHSDAKLDLVAFGCTGDGKCWVDEIRIGKNWQSVVEMGAKHE